MDEITITTEMTLREYYSFQRLMYGKRVRIVGWALVAIIAASCASSAALTWGTPASGLAGLALAVFFFSLYWSRQLSATQSRQAYKSYQASNTIYIFTSEQISATSRYGRASYPWAAVDRVVEASTAYLLVVDNRYIFVLKRNIPPHSVDDFVRLLKACGDMA